MPEDDKKKKPVEKKEAPKKREDLSSYEQSQVMREARQAEEKESRTATRTEEFYDTAGDKMYRTFEGGSVTETLTPEEAEDQGLVLNGEIVEERKRKAEMGQSVNFLFDSSMTPAEQLINENSFKEDRFIVVINGVPTIRSFLVK